jgi:putative FmdB family regulatory protein
VPVAEDHVPTYQYACTACGHKFEAVQSFSDASLTDCPECAGRVRKVFSSVGIVFKGSGFYRTDSRTNAQGADGGSSDGGRRDKTDGGKSDKSDSNGSGKPALEPAASTSGSTSGKSATSSTTGSSGASSSSTSSSTGSSKS